MPTKKQWLALLVIILLNQLGQLVHACEIEPGDWEVIEQEIVKR